MNKARTELLTESPDAARGHYCREQLLCRDKVIAWSHQARFLLAKTLVKPYAGQRLLDYGCGDGTFLYLVRDHFPNAVGVDKAEGQVKSCHKRFQATTGLNFFSIETLASRKYDGDFSVITCMEVLEHCLDDEVERLLLEFDRLLAKDGVLILSVPIETGPSLLIKEMVRTIAAWRGLGNYPFKERYRFLEIIKMAFAGRTSQITRPSYKEEIDGSFHFYHGHKGFNWRSLREKVERRFHSERILFSPCAWSLGLLSSQAWFVVRKKS